MERHSMFMKWKTLYCHDNITQSDLQIQCNPYKNSKGASAEIENLILKFMQRETFKMLEE